ncbi:TonB-dependent receptor [Silanimonas sp.]|uniref:TonB-dependent receptor n=1 Tax=Silanimonas sp. TaxID=1929290 RepID=UPI001BB8E4EA|nr:TonB-dependent receptor [Silanimonas sp.]MBS3895759.1 TonB-dependent receptor [Silanimonas sp.]MBS3924731.1 TonB-dependent receptor [Xanthomonadaceae bacterium]
MPAARRFVRPALLPLAVGMALAGTVHAAPAATAADAATRLDAVNVVGVGETRQVQEIGREELSRQPAGSSPLQLLAKLPGVHFSSADPWGNYEWAKRISIRGFNQQQLGFTLDGIPLGDMSYGNHNGLHISRALIAENLGAAEVSQGSAAIDTPSTSNLGGAVRFTTRGPQAERSLELAQTVGSDDTFRTFIRYDSGESNGFSSFVSVLRHDAEKWKGYGPQDSRQFNGQLRYATDTWNVGVLLNTSRRNETDYADLSLDSARRLGFGWDNYALDWVRAIRAAAGQFSGSVISLDDAYYLGRGLRDDNLFALNAETAIGDGTLRAQYYRHTNEGQGHWVTPYRASSPTLPLSLRTTEYLIDRDGITASIELPFGIHTFSAGLWFERNEHNLQRNFYNLNADSPPNRGYFFRHPDVRVFEQDFDTRTSVYFVNHRMELQDGRLLVDAGFRSLSVESDAIARIGTRAGGTIEASDNFLPQIGARFEIAPGFELFGSYAENMAAFRAGAGGSPFAASQAAFTALRGNLRPETSTTLEGGVRWGNDAVQTSLTLYSVDFQDRLLSIAQCVGILGCPAALANVGDVETRGVEAAIDWSLGQGLSVFGSISHNESTYASDYLDGTTVVRTNGKTVVDSPELLMNVELRWQRDGWEARVGAKYTDERFITFLNDAKVPDYWVTDASLSYDFGAIGWARELKATFNVTNLFDEEYFATVGTNGFLASYPNWVGGFHTLSAGAPRQMFLTLQGRF